ncbi:MAG: glycerol-3-phosphate acyltransferase [Faecousia sp.]
MLQYGILHCPAAGSGSAQRRKRQFGASNATVLLGWKAGILVALHDIGKAALVVLAMKWLFPHTNRYLIPLNRGIATPVCGLVRNDRIFATHPFKQQFSGTAATAKNRNNPSFPGTFRYISLLSGGLPRKACALARNDSFYLTSTNLP